MYVQTDPYVGVDGQVITVCRGSRLKCDFGVSVASRSVLGCLQSAWYSPPWLSPPVCVDMFFLTPHVKFDLLPGTVLRSGVRTPCPVQSEHAWRAARRSKSDTTRSINASPKNEGPKSFTRGSQSLDDEMGNYPLIHIPRPQIALAREVSHSGPSVGSQRHHALPIHVRDYVLAARDHPDDSPRGQCGAVVRIITG